MKRRNYILLILTILFLDTPSYAKNYTVFDVIGDSISAGVNPDYFSYTTTYGWVQMLFGQGGGIFPPAKTNTIYTLWSDITVYTSARSGSKASDWAANTGWLAAVKNHHPDLVVVYIGGNDMLAYCADGNITSSEFEQYRTNLTSIITSLQANIPKPDIILVNYYDLFDGYSQNLPVLFAAYRPISYGAVTGNQVICEVALETGCYLVDNIYSDFMHHCYGIELGDPNHQLPNYVRTPLTNFDIHPNTNGHSKIYENIYSQISTLKNITTLVNSWVFYH
jgi:hypothetical protein